MNTPPHQYPNHSTSYGETNCQTHEDMCWVKRGSSVSWTTQAVLCLSETFRKTALFDILNMSLLSFLKKTFHCSCHIFISNQAFYVSKYQYACFNNQKPVCRQRNIRVCQVRIGMQTPLWGLRLFSVRARALPAPKGSDISALVWSNSVDRQ